jgi:hypothetical protein
MYFCLSNTSGVDGLEQVLAPDAGGAGEVTMNRVASAATIDKGKSVDPRLRVMRLTP